MIFPALTVRKTGPSTGYRTIANRMRRGYLLVGLCLMLAGCASDRPGEGIRPYEGPPTVDGVVQEPPTW